jgi:oligoribonuclease NrnB/cAMP/cGMP phosphodiesterase (DHH superfamily)
MKVKLFTHTDLDGVGCAILAKMAFSDNVDIEYCNYDDVNEKVGDYIGVGADEEYDFTYITDISIKRDVAKIINEKYGEATPNIKLFDHHATALDLNKYHWCNVRVHIDEIVPIGEELVKTCGTELFFRHLIEAGHIRASRTINNFVEHVRLYDTWGWKQMTKDTGIIIKEFNDLLYILGRDEFIERCVTRLRGYKYTMHMSERERELLDRRQAEIDAYIDRKAKELHVRYVNDFAEECPRKYGIVFADRFVSELGNKLCETFDGLDYVAIVDPGSCKVSLRSIKEDVDVSVIAKEHGGGGHKSAAGYYFGREMQNLMIDAAMGLIAFGVEIEEEDRETIEEITENLKKGFFDKFRKKKGVK